MAQLTTPSLLSSTDFYLACGTVTVDPARRKVLIILDRQTGTYKLPRGRKDWGETLEATAERETLEETGVCCTLLPVPLSTRATLPSLALRDPSHPLHAAARGARFADAAGDVLAAGSALLAEPFALMQHVQPLAGPLAVVLWYVAIADSSAPLAQGTQMADEDYEARWVAYGEAAALMVNEDYAGVVKKGIDLARALEEAPGAGIGPTTASHEVAGSPLRDEIV